MCIEVCIGRIVRDVGWVLNFKYRATNIKICLLLAMDIMFSEMVVYQEWQCLSIILRWRDLKIHYLTQEEYQTCRWHNWLSIQSVVNIRLVCHNAPNASLA